MRLQAIPQLPLALPAATKTEVRTQFAALCYRMVRNKPEILLITSRGSGRWIVPKGWPMAGKTPAEIAELEAWEEAGVRGRAYEHCLGAYSYTKAIGPERGLPCLAMVYPVRVKTLAGKFPEAGQRKHKWLRPKKAAARVDEPELAHIIRVFDPHRLGL
ncbi:8-oxo-dGTP pyrophosphatase MutT, NUDIX family [Roseovarius lutimaris]|uniref:8-oxo-dGTP pyrophosphatase MutT, NUDIX family n=1 Tax=Roseovarius lutimaris TaxID=1005928 RepID=A0A1I5A9T9_9RHOB|nr:NUDIX hydrolase [Roseovarius lutimaris]SFN59206.1 8-oxo-dGTP pyrophosphatase MutT, NUDIX family [Roseovarius lutimaris]